jgi:hypothetical protein
MTTMVSNCKVSLGGCNTYRDGKAYEGDGDRDPEHKPNLLHREVRHKPKNNRCIIEYTCNLATISHHNIHTLTHTYTQTLPVR